MKDHIQLIVGLVLVTLIVIFTLQNAEASTVRFLFWEVAVSKSLLIFGVFAIGIISGWAGASWFHFIRKRRRIQHAKAS